MSHAIVNCGEGSSQWCLCIKEWCRRDSADRHQRICFQVPRWTSHHRQDVIMDESAGTSVGRCLRSWNASALSILHPYCKHTRHTDIQTHTCQPCLYTSTMYIYMHTLALGKIPEFRWKQNSGKIRLHFYYCSELENQRDWILEKINYGSYTSGFVD